MVADSDLEVNPLLVLRKVGDTIGPDFIDDCHSLTKNNDIVALEISRPKDWKQFFKKDSKDLNMQDFYLPRNTTTFRDQK